MSSIHSTAVVDRKAEVDSTAEIGAYSVVGPHVKLAAGVVLRPHAYVTGYTEIGAGGVIYSFTSVGEVPQDKKYRGEPTRLVIGPRNELREHSTFSPGTGFGGGITTIGSDNLFLIGSHVGHDCRVADHVIMANNVTLAGHVEVESHAYFGAHAGVHQFARVGESAMLSAYAAASQDVAPYITVHGDHARVIGVNKVGLERRGFSPQQIVDVERAFRAIFRSKLRPAEAFARVREEIPGSAAAEHMVAFLEKSERGFCRVR
jgi:UDP-N-acetylglucosamine acyltransferase